MNFNSVGSLLAVSSAHDTVHIFKLGGSGSGSVAGKAQASSNGAGAAPSAWNQGKNGQSPSSPSGSLDSSAGGPDYDALVENNNKKKGLGMS